MLAGLCSCCLVNAAIQSSEFDVCVTCTECLRLGFTLQRMQTDDRRLAELHYKASLTLHYLERPEEGLRDIKVSYNIVGVADQIAHMQWCIAALPLGLAVHSTASYISSN